jgi:hypothetical protein
MQQSSDVAETITHVNGDAEDPRPAHSLRRHLDHVRVRAAVLRQKRPFHKRGARYRFVEVLGKIRVANRSFLQISCGGVGYYLVRTIH